MCACTSVCVHIHITCKSISAHGKRYHWHIAYVCVHIDKHIYLQCQVCTTRSCRYMHWMRESIFGVLQCALRKLVKFKCMHWIREFILGVLQCAYLEFVRLRHMHWIRECILGVLLCALIISRSVKLDVQVHVFLKTMCSLAPNSRPSQYHIRDQ